MLVDTHCHLNHEQFLEDIPESIARAHEAGVSRMIMIGYDLPSSAAAIDLAEKFSHVYAVVGIHPHDAKNYTPDSELQIREMAMHSKVVAIGEIGLDYHYDFSPVEDQMTAFRAQLAVASTLNLPVVIHCREAYDDTLDVLESWANSGGTGVMHCWGGSAQQAERSISLGLYLGFGGVLTFKNAGETREIAKTTPLERIVLETDAPYLAPVPYRGKRNEPAYTTIVAESFALLRGMMVEEVARITSENAERLFPKLSQ